MKTHLTLVLIVLTVNLLFGQLHGTSPNWSVATMLPKPNANGDMTKGGVGQNIIQLSNGELVQCYTEKFPLPNGPTKVYLIKSTNDGLTWTNNTNYAPTLKTSVVYSPTIAKDTSDNIHIVWMRNVPTKEIYYSKMDKNFNVLIDTTLITQFKYHNSLNSAYITVDRKNRVHIMWHDGSTDSTSSPSYFAKTMYRQSPDGGVSWNNQLILSDTTVKKHAAFPRANFSGVQGDTIAIPWRQFNGIPSSNWDVWMAYSTNGGINWTRTMAAGTVDVEWDPGIVVDKNGRIHLHYHEYKNANLLMSTMEYSYSDNLGLNWMPVLPQTLSPAGMRGQLSVFAYDFNTNTQCICWKDERDFVNAQNTRADVMCSFSQDGGTTWQGQEFVTDYDSLPVGYKSVEVGNNNTLYLTYEIGDSLGRKTIYFSKRVGTLVKVNAIASPLDFQLYANPAKSFFMLELDAEQFSLQIYTVDGKLVHKTQNQKRIDVSHLESGVYFVELINGDRRATKKLIIQR